MQQPAKTSTFFEILLACIGCALIAGAVAANQAWFDRHFLPSFWTPREDIVHNEQLARIAVAAAGLIILFLLRKPVARFLAREPQYLLTITLAIVLGFGAAELVLRARQPNENPPLSPRLRHFDAYLGSFLDTSYTQRETHLGQNFSYTFDRNGYRIASPSSAIDLNAPTIVFTGESMMFGLKLGFPETIPQQVSDNLDTQCANIAVPGLATDQTYLRLRKELPRFRHPVAVVALFTPSLFDRNLDDDRPHLGPGLVRLPAVKHWRLTAIAERAIGYRSSDDVERGIAVTREVLAAIVRLSRSRGAVPLIVVPEFGAESPFERDLRKRILDEAHLPYVLVKLDPDDRVENDGHPDADAASTIGEAIAGALRAAT